MVSGLVDCIQALRSWKLSLMMIVRCGVVICTTGSVVLLLVWVLTMVGGVVLRLLAMVWNWFSCVSAALVQWMVGVMFSNWVGVFICFLFVLLVVGLLFF